MRLTRLQPLSSAIGQEPRYAQTELQLMIIDIKVGYRDVRDVSFGGGSIGATARSFGH